MERSMSYEDRRKGELSKVDQKIKATQHGRGGSSWPSRVEHPSCWGCGHDYLSRWSPEDLAQHPDEDNAPICPDCYEEAGIEECMNERKDDDLHQHMNFLKQHGFEVKPETYRRYSARRGNVNTGGPGGYRMDKGRTPGGHAQQRFYTDPHLSFKAEGPKGLATIDLYKGRSGRPRQPDQANVFLHNTSSMLREPGYSTIRVKGFQTSDPKRLAKKLKTMKPVEAKAIRASIIEQVLEKSKEKKPYNPMPEGPKDINPFEIHNYFMQMADWHEKEGRKHGQLGTFKPLFSRDRKHHDNRSQFHSQMQMAFAQKALDALNFQQEPNKPGVREALETMLHEMAHLSEARDIGDEWKKELEFRRLKNTPRVSPETHIRSLKGEKVPPSDAPEDVDPREWSRAMKMKKTESVIPSQVRLNNLKHSHPNTFKHLMNRSREARLNTGEADGEYGTYHHLSTVPPSKLKGALDHALVYHTATRLGPDMDYKMAGRLASKVRKSVPNGDVLGAFEKGELSKHVLPHIQGSRSDRYRTDKYY